MEKTFGLIHLTSISCERVPFRTRPTNECDMNFSKSDLFHHLIAVENCTGHAGLPRGGRGRDRNEYRGQAECQQVP